jgi:hypothetical protein
MQNRFQPDHKVGRPLGSKNLLHKEFVRALLEDFKEHGAGAIRIARMESPIDYLKLIARVLPKEMIYEGVGDQMTYEQLEEVVAQVQTQLNAPTEQPQLIEHEKETVKQPRARAKPRTATNGVGRAESGVGPEAG